jgi:beta-xylosidase
MRLFCLFILSLSFFGLQGTCQEKISSFKPGELWTDNAGKNINAHGGGIVFVKNKYYWFGEYKSDGTSVALTGVGCYSSGDLYHWKYEGIALKVDDNPSSDITSGCILERPKVIYNKKTRTYVMWFHLELKGKGYNAARVGIATSKKVTGPYTFIRSFRPNPGIYPLNMTDEEKQLNHPATLKSWTPEWITAVKQGMFTLRDLQSGQMSRDMTLYVDDNGKAYHIYASEENLTLHIAELSDDYLGHSGRFVRVDPAGHNEAPSIFKKDGRYFMITSGCTGWDPNAARLFTADHMMGPWTRHPNPFLGKDADKTFYSQSTFILPVRGRKDAFTG